MICLAIFEFINGTDPIPGGRNGSETQIQEALDVLSEELDDCGHEETGPNDPAHQDHLVPLPSTLDHTDHSVRHPSKEKQYYIILTGLHGVYTVYCICQSVQVKNRVLVDTKCLTNTLKSAGYKKTLTSEKNTDHLKLETCFFSSIFWIVGEINKISIFFKLENEGEKQRNQR